MPDSVTTLAALLREKHRILKQLEEEALAAMHQHADEASYRRLMRERACALADLEEEAGPCIAALPEELRRMCAGAVRGFSGGARNALDLDSVFYMSALLYPDEHKAGEPDNLERLIAELQART